MLSRGTLFTGYHYTHELWDEYWEGPLKRDNDNVGTVTTQTSSWTVNYGLTNRLNVIAAVPHVRTRASRGVLHGIGGLQDLSLAAKYAFFERRDTSIGTIRAITTVAAGVPLTDYNPELPPLSIGSGSKRVSWRGTLNVHGDAGWYVNGSSAYTWRSDVQLDRPYYFNDDEFVMSDRADMPNVVDYTVHAGYTRKTSMAVATFTQQRTLGGGDIRRQDMPFVANRMNFTKVGGMVMAPIPKLGGFCFEAAYAYTVAGRNVGQAHTFTAGLLYLLGDAPR